MRASFSEEKDRNIYSRYSNPNTNELIGKVAKMEGVEDGVAFASGMSAIYTTFAALLSSGDHIVSCRAVFGSTHTLYTQFFPKWGIEHSYFDPGDFDALEAAITPKTKMLWFSSPCNPSGSVYSQQELESLAEVLRKHPGIFVVSDEIYEHINFTGQHVSIAAIEGMYDRTITVNGVSKAFAMTGWRIGYIGAPAWIAKATNKLQGQVTSGANSIAQRATIAALEAPKSSIQFMIDEFHKRRDLILGLMAEIPGFKLNVPEGAFYVFPDVSDYFGRTLQGMKIENANDFALFLLDKANVATVTGEAFGNNDCIRISYAASESEIKEAMARIKAAVTA